MRPILFLDSGIGSLPYGIFFHSRNPGERLICAADRANFPYGPKSRETLMELLSSLTEKLISLYDPKILGIVCNTATVSALAVLRERFPDIPIVGTVPAIKPAVLASKKRCIGVLGTQRTIDDPYITELALQYGPDCAITGEAAPDLVEFVEHHWADADTEERLEAVKPWVKRILSKGADALVLACTHFLLLKDEFQSAGGSELRIFDSVEGISRRVESLLDSRGLRSPGEEQPLFLAVTGEGTLEGYWEKLAAHFKIALERI